MNSFVERYSTTSPISQLRRAQRLATDECEEFSAAAWGSEAGFGNLAKGLPTFTVPDVPDVSVRNLPYLQLPELITK
jgi:20S proteasome subunit beta 5